MISTTKKNRKRNKTQVAFLSKCYMHATGPAKKYTFELAISGNDTFLL
jgi:hypothetical protein